MAELKFYGVRGSCSIDVPDVARYGGNTSSVVLDIDDQPPILLDLGSGVRVFGSEQPHDGSFVARAFVTHLHFDHIQGLPFLTPITTAPGSIDIWAPRQDPDLATVMSELVAPPYFPVSINSFPGSISFHDTAAEEILLGDLRVMARSISHVGDTLGYRFEWGDCAVAYISDHQQPEIPGDVSDAALELAHGVDVLIHDAQFTSSELVDRPDWGHCTPEFAVGVAAKAGAKQLVLFHHDPGHSDEQVDAMLAEARLAGAKAGLDAVFAAHEGLRIHLDD